MPGGYPIGLANLNPDWVPSRQRGLSLDFKTFTYPSFSLSVHERAGMGLRMQGLPLLLLMLPHPKQKTTPLLLLLNSVAQIVSVLELFPLLMNYIFRYVLHQAILPSELVSL